MNNYIIAGLGILSDIDFGTHFKNFITDDNAFCSESELCFRLCRPEAAYFSEEPEFTVNQEQFSVSKLDDGFLFRSNIPDRTPGRINPVSPAGIFINRDYSEASVLPGSGLDNLIRLVIESRLISEGMITLHSSCIATPAGAICLTGPSGIGKSTRAAALCKEMNSREFYMISGDRPLIGCNESVAFGAPWDGKEQLHLNTSLPLHSVFAVRRLQEGEQEVLNKKDEKSGYRIAVTQTFLPMWDTDLAAKAMGNLKTLLKTTPVYEAVSGPDGNSVRRLWELTERI